MAWIGHIVGGIFLFFASLFGGFAQPQSQPNALTPAPAPVVQTAVASAPGNTPAAVSTQTTTANPNAPAAVVSGTAYTQAQLLAMAGPVDLTSLPLGDGKYTTSGPKQGYIYLCNVMQGGGGAEENGPWIGATTWNSTAKIAVQGAVSWPQAYMRVSTSGSTRTIESNDLPVGGTTGIFPIALSDPAHQYDANPNSIEAQTLSFSLPASPSIATTPGCIYGEVGIMNNGVLLLDGFDAEYRDAAAHEVQDSCDAHPHESGVYHYHSLSDCITDVSETDVIGWAFDGFPITGPQVAPGKYLSSADLDECHGLTSAITVDGKTVTTYHYVMTYDFPYSVSCFKGKSYEPKPGGGQSGSSGGATGGTGTVSGGSQSGSTPQTPPQAAIDACSYKSSGASCSFSTPNGSVSGTCKTPPNTSSLACVPN